MPFGIEWEKGGGGMERTVDMSGGGWLRAEQAGPRVRLQVHRSDDRRGLYKVWLRGKGSGLLLGTLVPEQGELSLSRTLSVSELERAGCWPELRPECRLAFPFSRRERGEWYCEQRPEELVSDPLVKSWIQGPMLCHREKEGFSLAAAFQTNGPMPLAGLFCLAQVERWPSGLRLVWRFDQAGRPVVDGAVCKPPGKNKNF